MTNIDWGQLARQIGAIQENTTLGRYEIGGYDIARKAIDVILGDELLRDAVNTYMSGAQGSEVILSVLQLLRPTSAMERCYEIYKSNSDLETRRYALFLLNYIADYQILGWVNEFLNDPDEGINVCGACVLDQLLQSGGGKAPPPEFSELLQKAETHPSERVREQIMDLKVRERFENEVWLG